MSFGYACSFALGLCLLGVAVAASVLHRQLSPLYSDVACSFASEELREFRPPQFFPSPEPLRVGIIKRWTCFNPNVFDVEIRTQRHGAAFLNLSAEEGAGLQAAAMRADGLSETQRLTRVGSVGSSGVTLAGGERRDLGVTLDVSVAPHGYPFTGPIALLLNGPVQVLFELELRFRSKPDLSARDFSVESTFSKRCGAMVHVGADPSNRQVSTLLGPTVCSEGFERLEVLPMSSAVDERSDLLLQPSQGELDRAEQKRDVFLGVLMAVGYILGVGLCIVPCLHGRFCSGAASSADRDEMEEEQEWEEEEKEERVPAARPAPAVSETSRGFDPEQEPETDADTGASLDAAVGLQAAAGLDAPLGADSPASASDVREAYVVDAVAAVAVDLATAVEESEDEDLAAQFLQPGFGTSPGSATGAGRRHFLRL